MQSRAGEGSRDSELEETRVAWPREPSQVPEASQTVRSGWAVALQKERAKRAGGTFGRWWVCRTWGRGPGALDAVPEAPSTARQQPPLGWVCCAL